MALDSQNNLSSDSANSPVAGNTAASPQPAMAAGGQGAPDHPASTTPAVTVSPEAGAAPAAATLPAPAADAAAVPVPVEAPTAGTGAADSPGSVAAAPAAAGGAPSDRGAAAPAAPAGPPIGPRSPWPPKRRPLDAHALQVLEFEVVRELLASYASCALGKTAALKLSPSTNPEWIAANIAATTELKGLLEQGEALPMGGIHDVGALLRQPEATGAPLDPGQFLEIASTLKAGAALKDFFAQVKTEIPRLRELAERLKRFDDLTGEIDRVVDADASVRDDASPKLKEIRRALADLVASIHHKLSAILSSGDLRAALENRNLVLRQGKAVVAVKATHRTKVPGVVVDRSATGATLFVEPYAVGELNNELDDKLHDERQEVTRLLWELTRRMLDARREILETVGALARIDLTFAKARFSVAYRMNGPQVAPGAGLRLTNARHPVLMALAGGKLGGGAGRGPRMAGADRRGRFAQDRPGAADEESGAARADEARESGEEHTPNESEGVEGTSDAAGSAFARLDAVETPSAAKGDGRSAAPVAAMGDAVFQKVVPISLRLGEDFDLLIVTGPNTGGKTVTLKTIGLLTLMAQAGLHIPADGDSVVPVFQQVYADIGDEQSIQQSLSTFSSHMSQVVRILRFANRECLVLLDELGSGTDPDEGAALGTAILDALLEVGARAVATTHLENLRAYAGHTPRAQNASVEFDVRTLRPTYRLILGQPGSSNALAIAKGLGLPKKLVGKARSILSRRANRYTEMIAQVNVARAEVERRRAEVEQMYQRVKGLKAEGYKQINLAKEERQEALEQAYLEIEWALQQVREVLGGFALAMHDAPEPWGGKVREFEQKLREVAADTPLARRQAAFVETLKPGDVVYAKTFKRPGQVKRVRKGRGTIELDIGGIEYEVAFAEVGRAAE